jgi:hypothetical protein
MNIISVFMVSISSWFHAGISISYLFLLAYFSCDIVEWARRARLSVDLIGVSSYEPDNFDWSNFVCDESS